MHWRHLQSSVIRYSRSIPSINIMIDTQLTRYGHLINSQSIVGRVSTESYELIKTSQLLSDCQPRCWRVVDQVSPEVSMKCRSMVNQGYWSTVTGHFANVSLHQRLMSVRQCLYVSLPMSKILLKCICKLPKEDKVTFDLRWIVRFGLKMFVSPSLPRWSQPRL